MDSGMPLMVESAPVSKSSVMPMITHDTCVPMEESRKISYTMCHTWMHEYISGVGDTG